MIRKLNLTLLFALLVLLLSFITRALLPVTPSGSTVFDEAYFVPQSESYLVERYYFDPHPPLGKLLMAFGTIILNPAAATELDPEKLANKVDDYKTPLDMDGVRLAPRVLGTLVPVLVFLITLVVLTGGRKKDKEALPWAEITALGVGLIAVFDNALIVESRYGLLTQIMLFFILLAVWLTLKYYYSKPNSGQSELWFAATSIGVGLALSVKWLALSVLPVLILLILVREYKITFVKRGWFGYASMVVQRLLFLALTAAMVYISVFAIHFSLLKSYSPAASEVSFQYQEELKTGEKQVGFMAKLVEWHHLAGNYSKGVPKLDYTKPDEIGSQWLTWPVLARPISYYWQTNTPTDGQPVTYAFAYMIGNPAVWLISLVGILMLSALGFASIFNRNNFRRIHFTILILYFANWLPFALITRVMYIYHFIPAMVFGIIAFGLVWHDFVLPRVQEVFKSRNLSEYLLFFWAMLIVFICLVYLFYAPMTYVWPLNKEQFSHRILMKEWNMKWPGGE